MFWQKHLQYYLRESRCRKLTRGLFQSYIVLMQLFLFKTVISLITRHNKTSPKKIIILNLSKKLSVLLHINTLIN